MGVYTGLHRDSWLSRLFLTVSLIGISLPTFLIGILLILTFGVWLGWLPTFGRGGTVRLGFWETSFLTLRGWSHIIMPAFTLALFQLTLIMRLVRAEMLEVLRTDYIKFARARGLRNRTINFGHALKNTLVPVITIMGLQIGALLAFSIITETVFQWPGMGLLIIQAIQFVDIPIMSSYLVLIALFFVLINLAVDLSVLRRRPAPADRARRGCGLRPWPRDRSRPTVRRSGSAPVSATACAASSTAISFHSFKRSPVTVDRLFRDSDLLSGGAAGALAGAARHLRCREPRT